MGLLLLIGLPAEPASLKITWFGTTCTTISDGKTTILFDPFFTRPSLFKVLSFWPLESDPKIVADWLPLVAESPIDGIFVSHTHYDHALDLVTAAKKTHSRVFGSPSAKNIALGGGIPREKITVVQLGTSYKVGLFDVTPLKGSHPSHFLGFTLASGKITTPLSPKSSAYGYGMGESFAFLISHPHGRVLFHPSGIAQDTIKSKADIVIQGIASRKSSAAIFDKILRPSEAKVVIPTHYDKLSGSLKDGIQNLPGVNLSEFRTRLGKLAPKMEVKTPKYGESLDFSFPRSPKPLPN